MTDPVAENPTVIRVASQADMPLLNQYVKAAVGRTFADELVDQARGLHSIFIALSARVVVGWGFLRWAGPRDEAAFKLHPESPEVYRLEVREDRRSQGVGKRLLQAMEEEARRRSVRSISLGVSYENPRAHALYESIGFVASPLVEYFDEYEYPLKGGGLGLARDRCRYLVKDLDTDHAGEETS